MRGKFLKYLCCVVILFSSVSVFAEKDPPPPENQPPPPGLPIDGGISFLLIVGATLGVYSIKKKLKD